MLLLPLDSPFVRLRQLWLCLSVMSRPIGGRRWKGNLSLWRSKELASGRSLLDSEPAGACIPVVSPDSRSFPRHLGLVPRHYRCSQANVLPVRQRFRQIAPGMSAPPRPTSPIPVSRPRRRRVERPCLSSSLRVARPLLLARPSRRPPVRL